jgi:quercetin dioxygenase-like cupin family protein
VTDLLQNEPVREVLASVEGLRVQLVSLAAGQLVPWHRHSAVTDTIVAVSGPVIIEIGEPGACHVLESGERLTIDAGIAHSVHATDNAACRFLNLHAGGAYDFDALPDADERPIEYDPLHTVRRRNVAAPTASAATVTPTMTAASKARRDSRSVLTERRASAS